MDIEIYKEIICENMEDYYFCRIKNEALFGFIMFSCIKNTIASIYFIYMIMKDFDQKINVTLAVHIIMIPDITVVLAYILNMIDYYEYRVI